MQRDKDIPFIRRREERRRTEHAATVLAIKAQPNKPDPNPDREQDQEWLFAQAKERLATANEAIRSTRTFFFALLSVAAYVGVIVWGTTDEQLLRITPVKLPIINVEVPLTGFYSAVPILFVLLHFNLLIHLGFTGKKLKRFLDDIALLDTKLSDRLRNDVANFPLAQWMLRCNDAVFHGILTVLVWMMLVLIPPFLLLWMQLRFLSYQDPFSTGLQAAAITVDALLIVGFRAWFVRQVQPETGWIAGAKELYKRRGLSLILWVRLLLMQPLFRYLFPLMPLGIGTLQYVELNNFLAESKVKCSFDESKNGEDTVSLLLKWYCMQYSLDLSEQLLIMNTPPPAVQNALRSNDPRVRIQALDEIQGISLRGRNLKGANFYASFLPKCDLREARLEGAKLRQALLEDADLRQVRLEGADLWEAQLNGADFRQAQLEGAKLWGARLEDADLGHARLEGADLRQARLDRANLRQARLRQARLDRANLRQARLRQARLEGANLRGARLDSADLGGVRLEGLNLEGVWLEGANLEGAQLEGANLEGANLERARLEGADLRGARLEGAELLKADLHWANLTDADLSFANLTDTKNLVTAELAGADYIFADGLEGTILDINQAPPDILPGPCDRCPVSQLSLSANR
jgi:uncharacterized protein YjbI with pentapeptide repeats